jgi:hypothetical protein
MMRSRAQRIEPREGFLRVHFGSGAPAHADYHWFWLRHQCDGDRHPATPSPPLAPRRLLRSRAADPLTSARPRPRAPGAADMVDASLGARLHVPVPGRDQGTNATPTMDPSLQ